MTTVLAVNGSPRMEKGSTAMILAPFLQGMTAAGAQADVVCVDRLRSSLRLRRDAVLVQASGGVPAQGRHGGSPLAAQGG